MNCYPQKMDLQNAHKCGMIGYGWQKRPGRRSKELCGGAEPLQINRKEKRIGQICQRKRKKEQDR